MSSPRRPILLLCLILVVAGALRFTGLRWDEGHAVHPDERRIAFALEEISFRPLQLNPRFFAYGSFPLYVQDAWTSALTRLGLDRDDFHGRIRLARALSALIGVAMVAWTFFLGRRLYGVRAGLLAALFLALSVLPIQHAHFITVDLWQAFLVLVVLERLVTFWQERRSRPLFVAAAVGGFALATKASSIPVLLPLFLAPLFRGSSAEVERSVRRRLLETVALPAIVLGFFFVGQPYAFLDYPAFLRDVEEQGRMVRNAGNVPYTIQYVGTRPYLDDLRQAFTWGMGPALGVAAGLGTLAALARIARAPFSAETLLLAFFVPYFLITGWFPVKFMRYLLPLYPLWCLFAARLALGRDDRPAAGWRKGVVTLLVAATAAYALAFASLYLRPHVWVTASRWFYDEVPAGSVVLTPHWEEGFPLAVDGKTPERYSRRELPLYEPDTDAKMRLLAERLAAGDALVFPSKRLYGAISNVPERFPKTVRFFELLFAGDLGYRLDRVFASRPRLLGIELDDDFADESFSVYDHPKTLIFRKAEDLTADEIASRIASRVPSERVTRGAMLGADLDGIPSPAPSAATGVRSSGGALALWIAALALLTSSGGRLLRAAVPTMSPIAARGLGRPFAYLLFLYGVWLTAVLGLASFSQATTVAVALILVVAARRLPSPDAPRLGEATVFYGTLLFHLAVRAGNPEIFWGEKPMDFSFLNALYRSATIPPHEPWLSGHAINYPYLGHFGIAALGKLTQVAPALAFNLGIATVAALTASAAFGVGAALTGRARTGLVAALLVAFAGNLAGPYEAWSRQTFDFHYFWATSRVIEHTINEFPLWSFLFADLHAHVLALPLSVLFLGLAVEAMQAKSSVPFVLLLAASLVLGTIATTSTWSWPVYCGAVAGLGLVAAVRQRRVGRLVFAALTIGVSYLWYWPYWSRFVAPPRNWGWEVEAAPLSGVLLVFGAFLLLLLVGLSDFARQRGIRPWLRWAFVVAVVLAGAHSSRALFVVLAAASLFAAFGERNPARALAFTFAVGAMLLGAATDTVFLWDRMNTIFKLYLEMWLFLAIGGSVWLLVRPVPPRWPRLRAAGLATIGAVVLFTAVTDVVGVLRTQRVNGPRPTLDGQAYLVRYRPHDARAIEWLQLNIPGTPVLLEAHGPGYQEFSRISMHTGLPTVLGWDYHLSQRAHRWPELQRRKAAVEQLYAGQDRGVAEAWLEHYDVALVYVGDLERQQYPAEGLAKFEAWDDLFQRVYENPGAQVFAVTPNFHWTETRVAVDKPSPESEAEVAAQAVPAEPAAGEPAPPGQLTQPRGIAVDAEGNVWVADFGNDRIQVFDSNLEFLRGFGRTGDGPGEFRDPCGIAVHEERVFVADTWNHRVQVFDLEGTFLAEWRDEFFGPRGIAVAPDGSVYVSDTGNGRLVKFTPEGVVAARIGKKGSGRGEFDEPIGIAISPEGRVFVADAGNQRVAILSPHGEWQEAWPVPGWDQSSYREPYLVALSDGRLAASDPSASRLLVFDVRGKLDRIHEFPTRTTAAGIAELPGDRIVTTQIETHRIVTLPAP